TAHTGLEEICYLRASLNLLAPKDAAALLAAWVALELHLKPGLVVFDTLARCIPGGDENSAEDLGRATASCDVIRRATGAAMLLVHHTGKDGLQERGSSALRGAADTMLSLKGDDGVLTLECTKQRDAVAIEPRQLRLVPVGGSCVVEPNEMQASTAGLTKPERAALEALAAVEQTDGATAGEWLAS